MIDATAVGAFKLGEVATYITTGITTDKEVEVLDGLNEGSEIVVSGTVSSEKSTPTNKNNRGGPGPM